jgi:hypothetical protein
LRSRSAIFEDRSDVDPREPSPRQAVLDTPLDDGHRGPVVRNIRNPNFDALATPIDFADGLTSPMRASRCSRPTAILSVLRVSIDD